MKHLSALLILICLSYIRDISAQNNTNLQNRWSTHFQTTVITQKHPAFRALYSGLNSLSDAAEPAATSLTSTLYFGVRLTKGLELYFDPEVSGGRGLSGARGVAGALNGETYRIGNPEPQVYVARAYVQLRFPLGRTDYEKSADDQNEIAGLLPTDRITIAAGRFALTDFLDDNKFSKEPRTQFLNWSLWTDGAWDYPANVRGYTEALFIEVVKHQWALRAATAAVSKIANSSLMEYNLLRASSGILEFEHKMNISNKAGKIRLIFYVNNTRAPSYIDGLNALEAGNTNLLNVFRGLTEKRTYGGHKYGVGINLEHEFSESMGAFCRAGWNDGKYASWMFTEIDRTVSAGVSLKGTVWNRPGDVLGIGIAINGISNNHKRFLQNGGYGFLIGDGKLNYRTEQIAEVFYNIRLISYLSLSADYQFIRNPGYNHDRGPVSVFGIRCHLEI